MNSYLLLMMGGTGPRLGESIPKQYIEVEGQPVFSYILAKYGMDVIDSGVAVLSMHAPWEVTSKADLYEAKKGYLAFLGLE